MIIILSEDIENKNKELIVNALYELTPKLPVFINYMKPIFNISGYHEKEVHIKVIGDDIYKADLEKEKKILKSLKETVPDKFLFCAWLEKSKNHRSSASEFNLDIIDNFDMDDLTLLKSAHGGEKILFLHSKDKIKVPEGIDTIKIDSFDYEAAKSFFEKLLTSAGEKLSFAELAELNSVSKTESNESAVVVKFEEDEVAAEEFQTLAEPDVIAEEEIDRVSFMNESAEPGVRLLLF